MRLYSGTTKSLIEDSTFNRISTKLKDAFFQEFRFQPSVGEVNSWNNSLRAVSQVFQTASLLDHGVLLELQLPLTSKRLDCLVSGFDLEKAPNAVVVELKQWEGCTGASGKNEVSTFVAGRVRDVLHPAAQVGQYMSYLADFHTAFQGDDGIDIHACSYLHNYSPIQNDPLFSAQFSEQIERCPVFTADDVPQFTAFLNQNIPLGDAGTVTARVEKSKYHPSKKLLDHVAKVVKGKPEYILLDEQLVVYDQVMQAAESGVNGKKKIAIIVRGGPGTGKSVIAMNLLGDLSALGLNAHYVTGSRAFTSTLREILGTRGAAQVKYFNSYMDVDLNVIGCVYTAQGFEFDYVGVIFGTDLVYVPESASWKGDHAKSFDSVVKRSGARFTQMVQNTYRVLLTRGMKGCYVTFMDKNTEHFFRSRMELSGTQNYPTQ